MVLNSYGKRPMVLVPYGFNNKRFANSSSMRMGARLSSDPGRLSSSGQGTDVLTAAKKRGRVGGRFKTFKQKLLANEPAQHAVVNDSTVTFSQNAAFTVFPTMNIVQGTAIGNRMGDEVFLEALKINGSYATAAAAGAYQMRLIVGYTTVNTGSGSWGTTALTGPDVFLVGTGSTNSTNQIINPKTITVLYDEIITANSQVSTASDLTNIYAVVDLKQRFPYRGTTNGVLGKFKNLVVFVQGYVQGGSGGVTAAGSANISLDLIFKNVA